MGDIYLITCTVSEQQHLCGPNDHNHLPVTCQHVLHTGYDNMEVNLEPVLDYIKAQNYKALEYEQNAKREASMSKWEV